MAKTQTIKLSQPIVGHGSPITEVTVREPTAGQYWANGEPITWSSSKEGVYFRVENDAAIKAYVELCVVEPKDPLLLGQMTLADAMAVKDAVLGFFIQARAPSSTGFSNSSSSTTESAA
jgi:hypothetical protein